MIINCIDCNKKINVVGKRKSTQKRCNLCYHKSRNKSFCSGCNKKLLHSQNKWCQKCYPITRTGDKSEKWKGGLPNCIVCNKKLSIHKNSKQYDTGVCQTCYKGSLTRSWNKELDNELRLNGRTINPLYTEWRLSVFKRDEYKCTVCFDKKGGNLVAHHMDSFKSFPEKRTDINNGITLCNNCHKDYHKIYGYINNTMDQFVEYIS